MLHIHIYNQILGQAPLQILFLIKYWINPEFPNLILDYVALIGALLHWISMYANMISSLYIMEMFSVLSPKISKGMLFGTRLILTILYSSTLAVIIVIALAKTPWHLLREIIVLVTIGLSLVLENCQSWYFANAICRHQIATGANVKKIQRQMNLVLAAQIVIDW
jgi:hypothetical protein